MHRQKMYCFAKFCRICLRRDRCLVNMSGVCEDNVKLCDMLSSVQPDTKAYQMSLPAWICTVCRKKLRQAYKFQRKCDKSFKILMNYLSILKGVNIENGAQKVDTVTLTDNSQQSIDEKNISSKEENQEDAQAREHTLNIAIYPTEAAHSDSSRIFNIYSNSGIKKEINCPEYSGYFADDNTSNKLICEEDNEHNSFTNDTDWVRNVGDVIKLEDVSDAESEETVIFDFNSFADKTNNTNANLINPNERAFEDVPVSKTNSSKNSVNDFLNFNDKSQKNTGIKPVNNSVPNNNSEHIKGDGNRPEYLVVKYCDLDTNTTVQPVDSISNTSKQPENTHQVSFNSDSNKSISPNKCSNFKQANNDNTTKIVNNSSHNLCEDSNSFWSEVRPRYHNESEKSNNTICRINKYNATFEQNLVDNTMYYHKTNNSQILNSRKLIPSTNLNTAAETIISPNKTKKIQDSALPDEIHSSVNSDENSIIEIKDEQFTFELDFTNNVKFDLAVSDENISPVYELPVATNIDDISEESDIEIISTCINSENGDDTLTISNSNLSSLNKSRYASQQTRNEWVQIGKPNLIVNTNRNSDLVNVPTIKQPEPCKNNADETNSKCVNISQITNNNFVSNNTNSNITNNVNVSQSFGNNKNILSNVTSFNLNTHDSTVNKSLSNYSGFNLNTNNTIHFNYYSTFNSSNTNCNESPSNAKRRKIVSSQANTLPQFHVQRNRFHWNKQILQATGGNHSNSEYRHDYIPSSRHEITDEFIDMETHIRRQQLSNLYNNTVISNDVTQNKYNISNSISRRRLEQHRAEQQKLNRFLTVASVGNNYSSTENPVISRAPPSMIPVPYQALNENVSKIKPIVPSNTNNPDIFFQNNVNPMVISNLNQSNGPINRTDHLSYNGYKDNISQFNKNQVYPSVFANTSDYIQQYRNYHMYPNPNRFNSNVAQNLHKSLQSLKEYQGDNNKNQSDPNERQKLTNNQETNIGLSVNCVQNSMPNNQQNSKISSDTVNLPQCAKEVTPTLKDPQQFLANIKLVSAFFYTEVDGVIENDKETFIFSIDNIKSLFKCHKCDQLFDCFDDLYNHSKEHISDFHYTTMVYRAKYLQEESYVYFEITDEVRRCKECGMLFPSTKLLMRHIWLHIAKVTVANTNSNSVSDPNRPAKCPYCDKAYRTVKLLQDHHQDAHQPKIQCKICKKLYSHGGLRVHKIIHRKKTFDCGICGSRFNQPTGLIAHKVIHTGKKPWSCNSCDKTFQKRVMLRNHERMHTGERPYECEVCKKRFTKNGTLQVHMRIHTGETLCKCDDCGKSYTQPYIYKHIQKYHSQSA